jgi:hypothetical protein
VKSYLTSFGIPGIGAVPYGMHICHFYPSRRDIIDGMVPYISAGLANNERCLWLASPPFPASEIADKIADASDLQLALQSGQLTISDAIEWHGEPATLVAEEGVRRLIEQEERALADGFHGLRVARDMSFVPRTHWDYFMEGERVLHDGLKSRRMLVCCSYHRAECQAVDVLDIACRHDGAVDRFDQHWEFLFRPPQAANGGLRPSNGGAGR